MAKIYTEEEPGMRYDGTRFSTRWICKGASDEQDARINVPGAMTITREVQVATDPVTGFPVTATRTFAKSIGGSDPLYSGREGSTDSVRIDYVDVEYYDVTGEIDYSMSDWVTYSLESVNVKYGKTANTRIYGKAFSELDPGERLALPVPGIESTSLIGAQKDEMGRVTAQGVSETVPVYTLHMRRYMDAVEWARVKAAARSLLNKVHFADEDTVAARAFLLDDYILEMTPVDASGSPTAPVKVPGLQFVGYTEGEWDPRRMKYGMVFSFMILPLVSLEMLRADGTTDSIDVPSAFAFTRFDLPKTQTFNDGGTTYSYIYPDPVQAGVCETKTRADLYPLFALGEEA